MSVIIRLQNLAWSANALDIRQFFRGLSIPEGGVHIVGGELGDAFIAFSTDEDARQAMMNDGGKIKEMKIKLLLSSRTEMQKVIEAARQQTLNLQSFMHTAAVPVVPTVQAPKPSPPLDKKDKEKDNDSESSKDRKDRRDRSRSRERSRSRDRDRDRDRRDRDRGRDRRRRDRSRSRDRERDRRDRRRRRERSRSRDRTRSRERDSKRNAGDRRKETNDEETSSDVVCVGQFSKDKGSTATPIGSAASKKGISENGVWEVPPQSQMQQAAMLAPGILGAGIAALAQDPEQRSLAFNGPVLGQQPIISSGQFAINGLNGVGGLVQPHVPGLGHSVGLNSLPPALGSGGLPSVVGTGGMGTLGRPREPWASDQGRLDPLRFPGRSGSFAAQDAYGSGQNSLQYRTNARPPNPFVSKVQELDNRRNPHVFQGSAGVFGFENGSERQAGTRSSGSGSRFSGGETKTPGAGYCVEVRNMPLSATYGDVRHAFQGIYIRKDGLKLINDNHGNRVGIAYVKFSKQEGKDLALSTTRYVRGSEVEVLHLEESLFDKAVDSYYPEREDHGEETSETDSRTSSCVLLSELPSYAKEMDIAKLFHEWKINDLFIVTSKEGSTTKYAAYVQFARVEDAESSLGIPLKIGMKQVFASAITEEKFAQAKRDHEQEALADSSASDCIIVRGLPFQTIDRDILDFFSDIGIVPHRIHMMLNQGGKPAGECFCEFDTPEEALRATAKNGLPLGKSVPSIELVPRLKMMETLGLSEPQVAEGAQTHYPSLQDARPRFSQLPSHHPARYGAGFGPRGPPGMMGLPRHLMGRHPTGSMEYVEGFGKPGCVLSLENVPFKADIDEIIDFFGDFDVKRENVIRRYNDKGMPTGDAKVAFASPGEAQRALRELRHCKMRERTIYMKIA
ncbi:uncharacterized protein LOC105703137 [Orussus abietinus]|uniref:uncharacterized protein LOC105703137 n=1 Tax=Orussus abietinus TaxID=222816 RepID=UPI000625FA6C|nr:uncharacterized protein LOC105703137 [Orussus abietinus]XP_012286713.1 uncharacterized protein LOC105703137 [Orussus abietinus]